ncbi:aspartate/glutamate racemase family protein [Falsirhodobacter sp. alg1]|uniref:aspartate/glutamate racemase family protein n=1 Tax=Falsirhodobacter sp. alg1 TaxID=1472418 RepID=UPI000786EA14|nr:aspartate/glutamate racemase family protein [Falsirhodobacter sp. alg1]
MAKLLVINPNSDTEVTASIERSLLPWARMGFTIECATNRTGPLTISSDEDAVRAGEDVRRDAATSDADAILVACFSDPGVDYLRRETKRPVFGVQESGILTAMSLANRYGIIALSERAVPRHMARIERLALVDRCAGEIGLSGYSALDVGRSDEAFAESITAGRALASRGAGAIVLGCAGFGPRRAALEKELGIPVIDPVLAGATLALGALMSQQALS